MLNMDLNFIYYIDLSLGKVTDRRKTICLHCHLRTYVNNSVKLLRKIRRSLISDPWWWCSEMSSKRRFYTNTWHSW